uniref:Inositol polyphosphate-related phosphatase domain-containing protein n=1 Tax=Salix viminalis TaxID=40686 RepID=A0A6N2LL95_SALVM
MSFAVGSRMKRCINAGHIESINQLLTQWFSVIHVSSFGSVGSGLAVASVRYPSHVSAPILISMSMRAKEKFVSFSTMPHGSSELSSWTRICVADGDAVKNSCKKLQDTNDSNPKKKPLRMNKAEELIGLAVPQKEIVDHEYVILFRADFTRSSRSTNRIISVGDLNCRVDLSYEETKALLEDKDWDTLLEKDQFKLVSWAFVSDSLNKSRPSSVKNHRKSNYFVYARWAS